MDSSWLIECVRRHLPGGAAPDPVPLRAALAARLSDPRKRRGIRHSLTSLLSVLVAAVACGHDGPLAIAQAAAGWDQELLAAHGCRVSPGSGLREAPSASTLGRLPRQLDADEFEAGLSSCLAAAALDPRVPALAAAQRREESRQREEKRKKRKREPPAAEAMRETRDDGWFRAAPGHPWLDPAGVAGHGRVQPGMAAAGPGPTATTRAPRRTRPARWPGAARMIPATGTR